MSKYFKGQKADQIKADDLNRFDRAADLVLDQDGGGSPGQPPRSSSRNTDLVRNTTAANLLGFAAVTLSSPIALPSENLTQFQFSPSFDAELCASKNDQVAILTEPIAATKFGHAILHGRIPAQVYVTTDTAEFTHAQATPGETYLTLAACGPIRVLFREDGEGLVWADVLLGVECPESDCCGLPVGATFDWHVEDLPDDSGDYLWARGQAVSREDYPELFALWGTQFGVGDGSTTFNVLDAQGKYSKGHNPGTTTLGAAGGIATQTSTTSGAHDHGGAVGVSAETATFGTGAEDGVTDDHVHAISSDGDHSHDVDVDPPHYIANVVIQGRCGEYDPPGFSTPRTETCFVCTQTDEAPDTVQMTIEGVVNGTDPNAETDLNKSHVLVWGTAIINGNSTGGQCLWELIIGNWQFQVRTYPSDPTVGYIEPSGVHVTIFGSVIRAGVGTANTNNKIVTRPFDHLGPHELTLESDSIAEADFSGATMTIDFG